MQRKLPELKDAVQALEVATPEDYAEADGLLHMVQTARRDWRTRFYGGVVGGKTYEPIIPPLSTALEALYAMVRDVDKPLEAYEKTIKAKQTEYKQEEARQQRELEEAQAQEQARIQAELDRVAEQEAAAKTQSVRTRLAQRREALVAEAEQVEREVLEPVTAAHSSTRTVPKWRVADMKLVLAGVRAGSIPPEVVTVADAQVDSVFKEHPDVVASWPGFELYNDILIVGRR